MLTEDLPNLFIIVRIIIVIIFYIKFTFVYQVIRVK